VVDLSQPMRQIPAREALSTLDKDRGRRVWTPAGLLFNLAGSLLSGTVGRTDAVLTRVGLPSPRVTSAVGPGDVGHCRRPLLQLRQENTIMKRARAYLTLTAIGLSAALLWGCDRQSDEMTGGDVSEEVDQAVEETQEAASAAMEQANEATEQAVEEMQDTMEETGDRIEKATD
jgi:hypothetical protein